MSEEQNEKHYGLPKAYTAECDCAPRPLESWGKHWFAVEAKRIHLDDLSTDASRKALAEEMQKLLNLIPKSNPKIIPTEFSVRWINIFDSEFNPDGKIGYFRIIVDGELA